MLVRYIMQDDPRQSPKENRLIESLSVNTLGFVPLTSLIELVWVVSACFDLTRQQAATVIESLLRTKEFVIDSADGVAQALRVFKTGSADFADCLIERAAASAGCARTMTFDAAAANTAGMTLVA